ncbi:hypothetical protein ACFP8W_06275 [Nocardioides hankookensis]|uniref:DNA-binding protein n=1 Tax=Nocardioides hankookensis TaxID=443157 RepID=A0ABW1LEX4_9ACTN
MAALDEEWLGLIAETVAGAQDRTVYERAEQAVRDRLTAVATTR